MMRSLYNGASGVKTNNFGYDVMANNISNVNTPGFIGSTWEFESMISQGIAQTSANPTSSQVGLGSTKMISSLNTWKQGNLQSTDGKFDMAIEGKGFFGVADSSGETYYTRVGSFGRDSAGDLVDPNRLYLQGVTKALSPATLSENATKELTTFSGVQEAWTLDPNAEISLTTPTATTKINLPDVLYLPPMATTTVDFKGTLAAGVKTASANVTLDSSNITSNLNTQTKTIDVSGNLNDDSGVYSFKTGDAVAITIADADGASLTKTVYANSDGSYSLKDFNVSDLNLTSDLTVSAVASVMQEVSDTATYTTDLYSTTGYKNILQLVFTKVIPTGGDTTSWTVAASVMDEEGTVKSTSNGTVTFDSTGALVGNTLGTVDNDGTATTINLGSGFTGVTLGSESAVSSITKDGREEGILRDYVMNDNGEVIAVFDNNISTTIAKVALYHFQNEQGLTATSSTLFQRSANSGEPTFWTDAEGNVIYGAKILSNHLEMSNVSLANELTDMITLSKAYTASAKSITTSDEILQTVIGLKR